MQQRRQVRGVLFLDYVRMLRRRQSQHLDRYLQPVDLTYLSERIDPDAWYPMETFERLGLAILGEMVLTESDAIRLWGRNQLAALRRYVPELEDAASPRAAIDALTTWFASLFDYPAVTVTEASDSAATIRVAYGMARAAEEAACLQTLGFFASLVEETGGGGVQARFAKTSWEGAAATEIELSWGPAAALAPMQGLRVLVVDDEPLVLAALQQFLRRWSDVICVSTLREAREVLGAMHVDAIVCDHNLGEGDSGLDFLVEVAGIWPDIGRVLHTALPPPCLEEELASRTIHAVAEKPVSPAELRRTVERAQRDAVAAAETTPAP